MLQILKTKSTQANGEPANNPTRACGTVKNLLNSSDENSLEAQWQAEICGIASNARMDGSICSFWKRVVQITKGNRSRA